jgi:hypothetical protein
LAPLLYEFFSSLNTIHAYALNDLEKKNKTMDSQTVENQPVFMKTGIRFTKNRSVEFKKIKI